MSKKFSNVDDEVLIDQVREFPCLYDHAHKDFKDFQIRKNIWSQIGMILSKSSEECKSRWKHIRDNYLKHKRKLKLGTGSAASTRPPKWPLFEHLKFLELVKSERSRIQNAFQGIGQNEESQDSEKSQNKDSPDLHDDDSDTQNSTETMESQPKTPQLQGINSKRIKLISETSNHSSEALRSQSLAPRTQSAKVKLIHSLEEQSNQRTKMLSHLMSKKEDDEIDLFMKSIALTVKKLPPHKITEAKIQILAVVSNLESQSTMTSCQTPLPSTSDHADYSIVHLEEPAPPSGPSYTILAPTTDTYTNNNTLH